jgi:hypothetical protein
MFNWTQAQRKLETKEALRKNRALSNATSTVTGFTVRDAVISYLSAVSFTKQQ